MNVYTYYVDVPGLWPVPTQLALIKVWEKSWKKAGWNPVVLTEDSVRSHPRFAFFKEMFDSKPSSYGVHYTTACFMRWLAVAHAGGGMMVDYDVMAYGFEPQEPVPGKMLIYADDPPDVIFMGAVLGSAQHYLDMSELFAAWVPDSIDFNRSANQYHLDDLSLIIRMFHGTKPKPGWLERVPGCGLFPHPSIKTSPMAHYGYAMRAAGYWPKCDHIEKLRPF